MFKIEKFNAFNFDYLKENLSSNVPINTENFFDENNLPYIKTL